MASSYAAQVAQLEAEYARLYDLIERQHGGVDYRGELAALRRELNSAQKNAQLFSKMRQAVESDDKKAGQLIMEVMLDTDDVEEVAANFIEDEIGRFDWMANWEVIKRKEDPVAKVQRYLNQYQIAADAQAVVTQVDRMTHETPGAWK